MDILTSPWTVAAFLSVVNKAVIDAIFIPVKIKFQSLDTWWIPYAAWVTGFLLSYFCKADIFTSLVPSMPVLLAQILTAILVGAGSDLFDKISKLVGSLRKV